MHGWLILDKPVGLGSTGAVSAVKRALRAGGYAKAKIGHGGTLDPLASGVLPVAIGEATKLAGRLLDSDKEYEFTIRFGAETDTLDAEGRVTATDARRPTDAAIEAVLHRFTGTIRQTPPAFSALKVGGERAYDLARAGEVVELAEREVAVYSLSSSPSTRRGTTREASGGGGAAPGGAPSYSPLHHPAAPDGSPPRTGEELEEVTLLARVSKGTYVRSLAREIARALDTVGHVAFLRRLHAGPFGLAHAITLDKLAEAARARRLEQHLLPLRAGLDDIPALPLTPGQAGALRQGRVLDGIAAGNGPAFALLDEHPVALVEVQDHRVRVVRGFNL